MQNNLCSTCDEQTDLCWIGGMPSFSSTLSLIRSMVSDGSMSISISLPVKVFTLIIIPPLHIVAHVWVHQQNCDLKLCSIVE